MKIPNYTTVVGVDRKHLQQLVWVWPTWKKCKSDLLKHPMIVFRDHTQVSHAMVESVVDHPDLRIYAWPIGTPKYQLSGDTKWDDQQRYKMLAGFVHVSSLFVRTSYWLKIDTDTVACRESDWIDPDWFVNEPAIICHPWGFTKPADQMIRFDAWVEKFPDRCSSLLAKPPLRLIPKPGWSRVRHKRIISWCGFFNTQFTRRCSRWANSTVGRFMLPEPTQDGFLWYCAARLGLPIVRSNMKSRGWQHWSSDKNVCIRSEEVMKDAQ